MNAQTAKLILLHGWGFTPAVWTPVIDALVHQGFHRDQIVAPRLPLDSSGLSETIEALRPLLPKRAHLVGWSLGGELALALANTMPDHLASLSLIASTPCFMNRDGWALGQPASLLDDFDQRLAQNPAALLKRFSMLIHHGDDIASRDRQLSETLAQASDSDPVRLDMGLKLLRHIDLRTILPGLETPTLLIHGAQDAVVPMAAAAWVSLQANASLATIEGASHILPLTHARQIADQLHRFIEHHS
jgi:pimeloyl-[acyl-carrier protein] methyl ester esterase